MGEYLQEVLGWKTLPPQACEPVHVEIEHKKPFAVFACDISPQQTNLLKKMMAAIGVGSFEILNRKEELSNFIHILNFSSLSLESEKQAVKVWSFSPLDLYLSGSHQEVSKRKQEAWALLQKFRQEVL